MDIFTFKVLAKKIWPSQLHYGKILERKAHEAYGDRHRPDGPFFIYVRARDYVIDHLLNKVKEYDYKVGEFYVWSFRFRTDADSFAEMLLTQDGLSYWLIGLSLDHTAIFRYPLCGYFRPTKNIYNNDPSETEFKEEQLRIEAHKLLGEFHFDSSLSVIFVTDIASLRKELSYTPLSNPIMIIDRKKSKPEKGGEVKKQVERVGTFDISGETYHYCMFRERDEVINCLTRLLAVDAGHVWHFAKAH